MKGIFVSSRSNRVYQNYGYADRGAVLAAALGTVVLPQTPRVVLQAATLQLPGPSQSEVLLKFRPPPHHKSHMTLLSIQGCI